MKKALFVLCAALVLSVAPRAAAQDVNAPIKQMLDGFNSNDVKAVTSSYASGDVLIIDEVPPFRWSGANANDAWLADLDKHDKAKGVTDGKVKAGTAVRTETDGDNAYVIMPVTYTYKEKGKSVQQDAHMAFVLHKENGAWKIASWVWTGGKEKGK